MAKIRPLPAAETRLLDALAAEARTQGVELVGCQRPGESTYYLAAFAVATGELLSPGFAVSYELATDFECFAAEARALLAAVRRPAEAGR